MSTIESLLTEILLTESAEAVQLFSTTALIIAEQGSISQQTSTFVSSLVLNHLHTPPIPQSDLLMDCEFEGKRVLLKGLDEYILVIVKSL